MSSVARTTVPDRKIDFSGVVQMARKLLWLCDLEQVWLMCVKMVVCGVLRRYCISESMGYLPVIFIECVPVSEISSSNYYENSHHMGANTLQRLKIYLMIYSWFPTESQLGTTRPDTPTFVTLLFSLPPSHQPPKKGFSLPVLSYNPNSALPICFLLKLAMKTSTLLTSFPQASL